VVAAISFFLVASAVLAQEMPGNGSSDTGVYGNGAGVYGSGAGSAGGSGQSNGPTGLGGTASQGGSSQNDRTQNESDQNSLNELNARPGEEPTGLATVLTANQIIVILHAKPEVAVDLKQVMADFFLKQGIEVQVDSITDEILFSNIANNAGLRQAASMWLRARGYASDADFAMSTEPTEDVERMRSQPGSATDQESENGGDTTLSRASQLAQELKNLPPDSELLPQDESDAALALSNNRTRNDSSLDAMKRPGEPARPATQGQMRAPATKPPVRDNENKIDLLHQTAPYNLQSLRDLYTQVPEQTAVVRRFGSDVFLARGLATKEMPIDLPIGPDYVLGPGDGLTISMWGGVSQSFTRVIDREGAVVLPEAGSVVVAAMTLERAQAFIQGKLGPQFKDAHVAVSVSRLRTVRVYVVGDVQRPGAYDISSLSTPLNALYAAGGPTSIGSLRSVRHYRGKTLIREVDLYDFLLHGVRADGERMEPGDTILVPAAGPQVEVTGMVKRPAIYEFKEKGKYGDADSVSQNNDGAAKGELKLSDVLDEAGGLRVMAALASIRVERIEADGHRSTVQVGLPQGSTQESAQAQLASFIVKDGDKVVVAPILPYSEKTIYMMGHVVRPGRLPYHDGMKLGDAVRSYQDLLPEPADHGEIVRLMPPDLHPEAIDFSVSDVLAGNSPIFLQPFDTIRIRGRYETDAPKVIVRGEVLQPGAYALAQGMTAAQLVRIAGGFKRDALLENADLASYEIKDGKQVASRRVTIAIGDAVNAKDANADALLKPGDVLTIHQVSGWNDIGASVTLAGEVTYPGTYGLQEGERLSSVIQRAGGFRPTAYPDGAVLVRKQVKVMEEESRAQLIRQIETTSVGSKVGQSINGGDDSATLQLLVQQQNQVLQRLRSQQSVGRLVIKIDGDVANWTGTPADIELRSGDVLTVPKRPGIILITGQVYNPTAISFVPGKDAGWYLRRAGGATDVANRKEIFVVRANGLVVGRRSGDWYQEKVLSTRLNPGDVVVVPQKIIGGSVFWRNMLATAQVVSSIAFTAALTLQ
jgi:protein involved in polysaccharide export with SLBB domain